MKKIKTTDIIVGSAMPLKSGSLTHLQSAYQETTIDTIQMLVAQGDTEAYPTSLPPRIMYGCRWLSGIGAVSQGAIIYGSELYRTDGAVGIVLGFGQVVVGTITTTYFTATNADPVTFSDMTSNYVHEIKKITWAAGAPGSGDFDLDDCLLFGEWSSITYNSSYLSSPTGTLTLPGGAADWDVKYKQFGRSINIDFNIGLLNLAGADANYLTLSLPFNADFEQDFHATCYYTNPSGTPPTGICIARAIGASTDIRIILPTGQWKIDPGISFSGQITAELAKADS